jgi:ubiquinone/menaquinone biosynthesis C-methylase UbiE
VSDHRRAVQSEFERAARVFAERTKGRFDDMAIAEFSRLRNGESVVEIGAGTGNFLALFSGVAGELVAVDVTHGMLVEARARNPALMAIVADGARLPLRSASMDLVASSQAVHHILEPVPILEEMRRVAGPGGRVLVVDQIASERFEEARARTELEVLRDPSHAVSRPASAFRIMVRKAGLEIIDERIAESRSRLSQWMWPGEFPPERIEAVREFITARGHRTGMDFEPADDDWYFTIRRILLLAEGTT